MTTTAADIDLNEVNERFANSPAEHIVAWAYETFGNQLVTLCAMTSDTALVDLLARVAPGASVVFLETGHHFAETHTQLDTVRARYSDRVNFSVATAGLAPGIVWQSDPTACCNARKVEPMEAALKGHAAWITGVRRADSPVRANTPIVEIDKRGMVKVNPIATWSDADLETYLTMHEVPRHTLLDLGYPSIGCEPCTRRVEPGEDIRAGRWSGTGKTECGLHV
jgi:phosphoadenosine phosphosulfate reductase